MVKRVALLLSLVVLVFGAACGEPPSVGKDLPRPEGTGDTYFTP